MLLYRSNPVTVGNGVRCHLTEILTVLSLKWKISKYPSPRLKMGAKSASRSGAKVGTSLKIKIKLPCIASGRYSTWLYIPLLPLIIWPLKPTGSGHSTLLGMGDLGSHALVKASMPGSTLPVLKDAAKKSWKIVRQSTNRKKI